MNELHEILRVTQEEMWQLQHNGTDLKTQYPMYYAVNSAGTITMWPSITDDTKIVLYWAFNGELYASSNVQMRKGIFALWRESRACKVLLKALSIRKRD